MDDERLTSLRAALARLGADGTSLGPEAAEALTLRTVLTVVTALPDIVAAVSPDGRILFVNRVVPGLTLEDVIGTSIFEFMPPDSSERARAAIDVVTSTGEPAVYEAVGPGVHGPESQYRTQCLPIVDDGRVIAVALVVTDITEVAERQAELRDSEARLQIALTASGAGLWSVELPGFTTTLDDRAHRILGLDRERRPSETMMQAVHPDDLPRVAEAFVACTQGGPPYDMEHRVVRADGTVRWVASQGVVLQDERGVPRQLVGTLRDITDRRQLEEQLRQSQKLEAVGQLTAGIAHNFNNLLAVILPNLELAAETAGDAARPFLHRAEDATVRAAELVRKLMTFAGKNRHPAARAVDPADVVRAAIGICQATFDRHIELELSMSESLPHCEIEPGDLEQALMNVMINARDAVLEHTRPTQRIRVVAELADPPFPVPPRPAGWVAVRVVDNGIGMTERVRQRAMEPFFTTKEVGKGTGLGLAMTYALIRGAGGHVEVTSSPDIGTSVTIWLPGSDPSQVPVDRDLHADDVATSDGGRPLVLVVDDEAEVRTLMSAFLSRAGFKVIAARDGEAAMLELRVHTPAVVVLDLSMPGPHWTEILAETRKRQPTAKVLIYTGLAVEADDAGADAVLQKPATGAQLVAAVRRLIQVPAEPT